jgi:hypothetical protein
MDESILLHLANTVIRISPAKQEKLTIFSTSPAKKSELSPQTLSS